ncbi:uncharacterized protein LOC141526261 [Cotesia typhae]|uniref:uncharacterized protein LOC141526261 n=1 Tax=Cotesia typhae TaxID=2053667 RepID=UPI003D69BC54
MMKTGVRIGVFFSPRTSLRRNKGNSADRSGNFGCCGFKLRTRLLTKSNPERLAKRNNINTFPPFEQRKGLRKINLNKEVNTIEGPQNVSPPRITQDAQNEAMRGLNGGRGSRRAPRG